MYELQKIESKAANEISVLAFIKVNFKPTFYLTLAQTFKEINKRDTTHEILYVKRRLFCISMEKLECFPLHPVKIERD